MSLWPIPIDLIWVCGEPGSGKTLFSLGIDPANTIHYDFDDSAEAYEATMPFTRVSVNHAFNGIPHPSLACPVTRPMTGYDQLYEWWLKDMNVQFSKKYSVIVLDTIEQIEQGLSDYVMKNPGKYGYTATQFEKSGGIYWGIVKREWVKTLKWIKRHADTVVAISHMRSVWSGSSPVKGKREPAGKESLLKQASLQLLLERKVVGGKLMSLPSGTVLKERLCHPEWDAEKMQLVAHPKIPTFIPQCTPAAIRKLLLKTPDYSDWTPLPETRMTEEEKLELRLAVEEAAKEASEAKAKELEAEADVERARNEARERIASLNAS